MEKVSHKFKSTCTRIMKVLNGWFSLTSRQPDREKVRTRNKSRNNSASELTDIHRTRLSGYLDTLSGLDLATSPPLLLQVFFKLTRKYIFEPDVLKTAIKLSVSFFLIKMIDYRFCKCILLLLYCRNNVSHDLDRMNQQIYN